MKTFFQLREETSGQTIRVPREIFEAALDLMEELQQYDEDDELDEELSPEKKKAMKLGYQLGRHGTMKRYGSESELKAKDYKGADLTKIKGRDKAAAAHLAATKGKGTAAAFDKGSSAAFKSDVSTSRAALARARSGESKRQGPPDVRAGYFGVKGPESLGSKQLTRDPSGARKQKTIGPARKLPENSLYNALLSIYEEKEYYSGYSDEAQKHSSAGIAAAHKSGLKINHEGNGNERDQKQFTGNTPGSEPHKNPDITVHYERGDDSHHSGHSGVTLHTAAAKKHALANKHFKMAQKIADNEEED